MGLINLKSMQRISYVLFIFLLIFCPLAFGTVETWSITILETITAISFLLLSFSFLLSKTPGLKIPGIIPLFLLLGFMSLQLLPLPIALVKLLSPSTWEIYQPLLELNPEQKFIQLTVHRKSTLLMLFTFAAYGLIYLMTVYHCSRAKRLKQTISIVTALGIFIAILAIIQKLTSPGAIYWFRSAPSSSPIGPWVYSNHFAGYMGMLFPLTVALFLFYRPQVSYDKTIREKFVSAITMPGANLYLLLGTGAILMAVSILLSISRGGIITLILTFLFFTFFSARTAADSRKRWTFVLIAMVMIIISWLGWQPIIDKFGNLWGDTGLNTSGRLPVLLDSINLFRAYPLFGSGFGTFIHMYPSVRTVPGEAVFSHAHNDYIELLANGGLIGFLLCGWFVLAVLIHSIRMLIRRRDRYSILITCGALTGLLAFLFHSQADFQMYNGANGLYFFFLCGLLVSAANTRLQYRTRPTLLKEKKYVLLAYPCAFAFLLLVSCSWFKLNMYKAEKIIDPLHTSYIKKYLSSEELTKIHTTITQFTQFDPLEAEYSFWLGQLSSFLGKKERAEQEYLQACMIQPTSGQFLQQLGISLTAEQNTQKKKLMALGLERNPLESSLYFTYSEWLLRNNQRPEAFAVLNQAMEKIPWKIPEIIDFMLPIRFTISEVEQLLLALPAAWYEIGRTLEKNGQPDKAEIFYNRSIEIAGESEAQPASFIRLYSLYQRQKDEEKALDVLRLGIQYLPDYAPFRIYMGDYYLKQGIQYRAVQEYTQALKLDPNNIRVRRKLEKIKDK